ncbi:NAD(P)H-dependent oxidoreductase [Aggregatibacter actinomycetemcomitans]|nr:NAD(P)H-dependent oxidoreductase [Aggregatibacter actinomycetemcomitans]
MGKILVIVAHPDIRNSVMNKRWIKELKKFPERFTVHNLYDTYPDGKINVEQEQALVEQHSALIFQFPVYWFSCPPLLKAWFDDVLTHGWAYGSKGKAFIAKKMGIAVSLGTRAEDYSRQGAIGYDVSEVLRPFELIANYVNADYRPLFVFHTIDSNDGYSDDALMLVEQSVRDYSAHLEKYFL